MTAKNSRAATDSSHSNQHLSGRHAAEEHAKLVETQQQQLRVTLASIGDGVVTTDAQGKITLLNPVAEALTGWTNDEAAGQPLAKVFQIINEVTRQTAEDPVGRVIATGHIVGLANHTVLIARDGTERAIDDSAAPIRDQHGNVSGVVLVFRDVTEKRQADRTARFLASIVECSDDAIIGKDMNGVITSWNQGAQKIFGYSAAEAIGRPIAMLAPPDRADEMTRILNRIRRGERVDHFDTVRCRKDGEHVPISLTVSPIRNDEGLIIGASKICRDISERKRAEEALREEKARLHATLIGIGDAVIVTDADCRITMMNPVAQTLTGWDDQGLNRPLDEVFSIVNEHTRQRVENPVDRVMREGTIVGLANHTVLIARDGTERPIDDSAAPVRDKAGHVVGVVLVFRDVTERRRADEALRRTTEQLQIVTESMAALVTRCSRDLKYLWVSRPYANWMGRQPEEIVGRPISDIVGEEAFEQLRPHFERVLAGETIRYEERISFRGIGPRWINATYAPTFSAMGMIDGWVAVVNDIDDRKRMDEELQNADRRKDEFLAILAHELRNPLAPISNAIELLRYEHDSGITEQARSVMERQVGHLVRLVDDLLDTSRITRGKLELRKERVELASVILSAEEAALPHIKSQSHEFTLTLPPDPIDLDADPIRLSQAFANLLNNAAKFTEKGGRIRLSAERQGREVVVSVRDTGIGIAQENLHTIFNMFSQVHPALKRAHGGLGIGLTLVRGLIELHGGTVEARSDGIGQGSEFIVRLPVLDASIPAEKKEAAKDAGMKSARKLRILVVDDNQDAATSLVLMVQTMMGHETMTAFDGLEAIQAVSTYRPDVVLLDIGLPKRNGYEVACHIREQSWGKKIVLVAITGWGQVDDKRRALEAGFNYHLTKPVQVAVLENLLATTVSQL
jgi:PAS domain S-box-containing protein